MSAATKNDLCNRALSLLGEPPATPFTGGTTIRDRECVAHYEAARDEVLTHHRWDFAKKGFALDLVTPAPANSPPNYPHAYAMPTDCLRFHEVELQDGSRLEQFAKMGQYLYAAYDNLSGTIFYTSSQIEPEEMSSVARECVAYALAVRIGELVSQNPQKVAQMQNLLDRAYMRAITTESRETGSNEYRDPLSTARQCGTYRARYRGYSR